MWIHKDRKSFGIFTIPRHQILSIKLKRRIKKERLRKNLSPLSLEFCISWSTREWNHISYVRHASYEQKQSFKSQSESGVRA